jgi:predicted nucleotidyltransferase
MMDLLKLLLRAYLNERREEMERKPVGGTVEIKGLARGLRFAGGRWKVAVVVLERTG